MDFQSKHDGFVFLPLSPNELADIVRANVRAELDSRFPTETQAESSDGDPSEQLLTVEQTAELLDVSRVTLNDWEKKDILLPVRLGRRVYYKRGDIYKALQTRETVTAKGRRTHLSDGV